MTVCHWIESVQLYRYQAEPTVRINMKRNNWTHHSFYTFSTFIVFYSHSRNKSFSSMHNDLTTHLFNFWAEQDFSAGLKPSRQCSCRLYHTEIYIVCQVHDSTKEFILRSPKPVRFSMSARLTLIICQPSTTQKHLHKDSPLWQANHKENVTCRLVLCYLIT